MENQPVYIDGAELEALLPPAELIDTLSAMFAEPALAPARMHFGLGPGSLLLMPAWRPGRYTGCKLVTIHPGNRDRRLPTIHGLYTLFDGATGRPLAVLDGRVLTLLRTAAASALAVRHLARMDVSVHLMIGAGALAPYLIRFIGQTRPIARVLVWNRTRSTAEALCRRLTEDGVSAEVVDELAPAIARADIVSAATQARQPLIEGSAVRPGTHLDLVGAYMPEMAEADTLAVSRSRVFVDTRDGAKSEAGDLIQAADSGKWTWDHLAGDLHELVSGAVVGRRTSKDITVFKSVGTAIEDLAAAGRAWEELGRG